MMFHDPKPVSGAEENLSGASQSNTARSARQADLVSRILLARRTGDTKTEKVLSTELLVSVRPVIKQVVKCARRFGGSQSTCDLEQTASIAVLRTIDKFDPTRGGQSFGEVVDFRARSACDQFARMHAADVNLSDGAHKGRTAKGRQAERGTVRIESTDAATTEADRGNGRAGLWDEVEAALRVQNGQGLDGEDPELLLLAAERRATVFEAVRHLAPEARELVCRDYGINRPAQSVRSVAEALGAPKSRVDRMLVKALAEFRGRLVELGR